MSVSVSITKMTFFLTKINLDIKKLSSRINKGSDGKYMCM